MPKSTSPIRPKGLIDNAIRKFKNIKSILASGRILHNYEWGIYNNLPRQKLKGWFWDDGLIYVLKSNHIKRMVW